MQKIKEKDLKEIDIEKEIKENEKKINADLILKNAELEFEIEKQKKVQADLLMKMAQLEGGKQDVFSN